LETALRLSLRLVGEGVLSAADWVRKISMEPARMLRVGGGTLRVGAAADVAVVDPAREWRVEPAALRSKSKNSPFLGWTMKGRAAYTLVGGRVVHEEPGR